MAVYDPIDLVRIIDDPDLAQRVEKNFQVIRDLLLEMQVYENKVGISTNTVVADNKEVWDRASNFTPEGKLAVTKLTDTLVGLEHDLQLAEQAVTEAKIAIGAIKTPHLDDGSVTDMKLASGSIKENKLNWQTHLLY